jgi:hypothetical protein
MEQLQALSVMSLGVAGRTRPLTVESAPAVDGDAGEAPLYTRRTHDLKTDPQEWDEVAAGRKTFEIRIDDHRYAVGDVLVLRKTRFDTKKMLNGAPLEYLGPPLVREVAGVMRGPMWGLARGWVIMSLSDPQQAAHLECLRVNLLQMDWLLGVLHEAVWNAAQSEAPAFDEAGTEQAKAIQAHLRGMLDRAGYPVSELGGGY